MATDPRVDIFMPIYVGDFLADTLHLSTEQIGAFFLLLLHQWRVGHFSEDEVAQISRLAGSAHLAASSSAKQELSRLLAPVLQLFIRDDAGRLFSRRADAEKTKWTEKKKVFTERARKGGEAKAKKYRERMAKTGPASSTPKEVLEPCTSPLEELQKPSAQSLRSFAAAAPDPPSALSTPTSTPEVQPAASGKLPSETAPAGAAGVPGDGKGGKGKKQAAGKDLQPQQHKSKNGSKPADSDPRHVLFKSEVFSYWKQQNPEGTSCPWDGAEAAALTAMLRASPNMTLDSFKQLLRNRARSEVNPADLPRAWLRDVMRFQSGPLDRFNKPMKEGRKF